MRRMAVFRSSATSRCVTGRVVLDVSKVPSAFKAGIKQSEKILFELLEPTRLRRYDAAQRPMHLSQWRGEHNIPEDSNSQPQTWRPWVGNRTVLDCSKIVAAVQHGSFDVYWTVHRCDNWRIRTRCCVLFYYTYDTLNMFRALLCPSSGAHDYSADYHVGHPVLGLLYTIARSPDTYPACLHLTSNQQQPKNRTANVVIGVHNSEVCHPRCL